MINQAQFDARLALLHSPSVDVLSEIAAERVRQNYLFGEQNISPNEWMSILTEEVGEVAKEVNEARFNGGDLVNYRTELVQVAAVAAAMIECLDRAAVEAEKPPAQPPYVQRRLSFTGARHESAEYNENGL